MMQPNEGLTPTNITLTPPIAVEHHLTRTARGDPSGSKSLTRLAVLTGILLPIAVIPYLLARRRISCLRRRIDELESKLIAVERRVGAGVSNIRDEQLRMRATLHDMTQEADEVQQEAKQRSVEQRQTNQAVRSDLRSLLEEARHIGTHAATLRAVGMSLADIAAFMHEIELQMGLQGSGSGAGDKRGIHRLRQLALRMQRDRDKQGM